MQKYIPGIISGNKRVTYIPGIKYLVVFKLITLALRKPFLSYVVPQIRGLKVAPSLPCHGARLVFYWSFLSRWGLCSSRLTDYLYAELY